MRRGFTMIELIFVIVILGILAAVALPKFVGVSEEARAGKVAAFVGTLNRTVFPSLWSYSLSHGSDGNIRGLAGKTIADYTEIPSEVTITNDIAGCATDQNFSGIIGTFQIGNGQTYNIYCRDGNLSNSPLASFSSTDLNTTVPY